MPPVAAINQSTLHEELILAQLSKRKTASRRLLPAALLATRGCVLDQLVCVMLDRSP